jgi:septum formation protein
MTPDPPRLILASSSPRRQQLLRDAGYDFIVHPANIDEDNVPINLIPVEIARYLAFEKAQPVATKFPSDVILAADTVVAFGDQPLGKPENPADATRMISLLSATTHIVITGVTVMVHSTGFQRTRSAMSAVRMRRLLPREIEAYVKSGDWRGKAGGYGIQDNDPFVTRMAGSHSNIVGLPMELTSEMLADAGIFPKMM